MVYFSPSKGYDELALEQLASWPFWLAHYTEGWSATTFRYHFAIWQYAEDGQVDGITGKVDLDLCLTDFSAW
jgi:GH25 family lysozyme M1 (1,4-beta-N-acetylmuramidase)